MTARVIVLAFVLLAAACGSDDADESEPAGDRQRISLTDFALEPASVELDGAGTVTFEVVNDGQTAHALEVDGKGIEEETALLEPGASAELTVELEEGDYELYCPVGDHREQGMEGTLVVGAAAAGSSDDETDTDQDYPYGP